MNQQSDLFEIGNELFFQLGNDPRPANGSTAAMRGQREDLDSA
jgi:hypothetical protein